ncbi:MAG TPA: hypothetical protein VGG74_35050 [Kofleriaceae bacterium]|jgi:hypothetical protein
MAGRRVHAAALSHATRYPPAWFVRYYQKSIVTEMPFARDTWRTPGPRTTESGREAWFRDIVLAYRSLGTTSLDLGLPLEAVRGYFIAAARAAFHFCGMKSEAFAPDDGLEAFFGFGIARDIASTKAFAETYASNVYEAGRNRVVAAATDLLVAHALGTSMSSAVAQLEKARTPKAQPFLAPLRDLAIHVATARKPAPLPLLQRLLTVTRSWRFDPVAIEAYACTRGLALACIARDRGWRVPDEDPEPSLPLGLLRLPETTIDLSNRTYLPPPIEIKRRVAAARKAAIAYPR